MGITDDEIDRAVCSVTPTRSATPAPAVLDEMRAAKRRERMTWMARRVVRAVDSCALIVGYIVIVAAVAALLLEAFGVGQ